MHSPNDRFPGVGEARVDLEAALPFFRHVPLEAWTHVLAECPAWMDKTTRVNAMWNRMMLEAARLAPEFGLRTSYMSRGRKVLLTHVDGARFDYVVRFNKMDGEDLRTGGWPTRQRQMFESQIDTSQPSLPGFNPVVNLKAGYVLDQLDMDIMRTPIVLSLNDNVVWYFDNDAQPAATGAPVVELQPRPGMPTPATIASSMRKEAAADAGSVEGQ